MKGVDFEKACVLALCLMRGQLMRSHNLQKLEKSLFAFEASRMMWVFLAGLQAHDCHLVVFGSLKCNFHFRF